MPWGKVDEGELLRETAIREVQEEKKADEKVEEEGSGSGQVKTIKI